jgi:predicted Fe-Mo cluster-binding NifX family protein
MKICFPTENLAGLDSVVFEHFGSAPGFVIVDSETTAVQEIRNGDLHHAHGMCQPLMALRGQAVDALAVSGIGMGALSKLQAEGIRVYRATGGTVQENLDLLRNGRLPQFDARFTCGGHVSGGCGHC